MHKNKQIRYQYVRTWPSCRCIRGHVSRSSFAGGDKVENQIRGKGTKEDEIIRRLRSAEILKLCTGFSSLPQQPCRAYPGASLIGSDRSLSRSIYNFASPLHLKVAVCNWTRPSSKYNSLKN